MDNTQLFQPVLQEAHDEKLKSFNLYKLVIPAVFGGLPTAVFLGTLNVIWLRAEKRVLWRTLTVGFLLLVFEATLFHFVRGSTNIFIIHRVLGLLMAIVYGRLLRERYQLFRLSGRKPESLLILGTISIVIGIVVESMVHVISQGGY